MGTLISALLSASILLGASACDPQATEDVEEQEKDDTQEQDGIDPSSEDPKPVVPDPGSDDVIPSNNHNGGPNEGDAKNDCGTSNFKAQPVPPNVMLVLDKSGSMSAQKWQDNGVLKSRWASLYATTKFLLESFDTQVNFGLKLFPSKQDGPGFDFSKTCSVDPGVDVPCKSGSGTEILDYLPKPDQEFMGSTPTVSGLQEAYKHLVGLSDANPEAAILIVDGRTNCAESNNKLSAIAGEAFSKGILVYVVGIDLDALALASLAPVAAAGGTEKVYNSADSKALGDSLEKILGGISSCTIPLDSSPPYKDLVEVKIGGKQVVPYLQEFTSCEAAEKAGSPDGWVFHAKEGPFKQLELCGSSCADFKKAPKVDVAYECPPPV